MKLYGAIASPYVTRVVMLARIKGVEIPLAGIPGNSPRSPEYMAFNPIAKIPSLDVDGRCIPESEVICEYIEETAGGEPALPGDPLERATSRSISRIIDLYIAPHTSTFFQQMNPATRDANVVAEAGTDLAYLDRVYIHAQHRDAVLHKCHRQRQTHVAQTDNPNPDLSRGDALKQSPSPGRHGLPSR